MAQKLHTVGVSQLKYCTVLLLFYKTNLFCGLFNVTQTVYRRIIELSINNELEGIRKEAIVA
jgi:hypothetical protein